MKIAYSKIDFFYKKSFVYDGKNKIIDGNNAVVHLLRIHNSNITIKNLTLKRGNTNSLRLINRNNIPFKKNRTSIFERV